MNKEAKIKILKENIEVLNKEITDTQNNIKWAKEKLTTTSEETIHKYTVTLANLERQLQQSKTALSAETKLQITETKNGEVTQYELGGRRKKSRNRKSRRRKSMRR